MARQQALIGYHPNSLEARAGSDRELRRKIDEGRARFFGSYKTLQDWAKQGCVSEYAVMDDS